MALPIDNFQTKPTPACYSDGLIHQITSYQRIDTIDEMRMCLAGGFPFVFGFTVYESFESPVVAETGEVNMPRVSELALGGHAVLAVGYDDDKQRFDICA